MSIENLRRPLPPLSLDDWRAVMHDVVDQVLDEILDAAEDQWPDDLGSLPGDDCACGDCACGDVGPGRPPPVGAGADDENGDSRGGELSGDPPPAEEFDEHSLALREKLAASIVDGTGFWGCDGTLRVTAGWSGEHMRAIERFLDGLYRSTARCDCAVLHTLLGRPDIPRRCLRRFSEAAPLLEDP